MDKSLPCPVCAADLEYHPDGIVEVPVWTHLNRMVRKTGPAPFLACPVCDWCETVANVLKEAA